MDYTLAALKVLCIHLKDARQTASQKALTLGGMLFQRVWVQGIIVSADADGSLLLDDGTGLFRLTLTGDFLLRPWHLGMYVMVVGRFFLDSVNLPLIQDPCPNSLGLPEVVPREELLKVQRSEGLFKTTSDVAKMDVNQVHKMVDLSSSPDREALWYLEVMEAYKMFYQPLVDDFL